MRVLSDVDMMILPHDRGRVEELMGGLGYVVGKYDWSAGRIVKLPRQDQIMYQLNPDHLPHFVRLTPNPPKDTDGRREDSGRGWVRELQGRWPGVLG